MILKLSSERLLNTFILSWYAQVHQEWVRLRTYCWWSISFSSEETAWNVGLPAPKCITKTCLYIFEPLKPHFYIVKLGFTGVCIIFLIFAQKLNCEHSLEPPRRGGSNEYPQSMFWATAWKISELFYLKIFNFWWWTFLYIWTGVFS